MSSSSRLLFFVALYSLMLAASISLLGSSLDYASHLDHIDYYLKLTSGHQDAFGLIYQNNSIALLCYFFGFDPIFSINLITFAALVLWPFALLRSSFSLLSILFAFSTLIPLINLTRQFLALSLLALLVCAFRESRLFANRSVLFFSLSILLFSLVHFAVLIAFVPLTLSRLSIKSLCLLSSFLFVCLLYIVKSGLFPLPSFLLYSANASTIQGNFLPSLAVLVLTSFILYGAAYAIKETIVVLLILLFSILCHSLYGFNQFIYLSRLVWSFLIVDVLVYLISSGSRSAVSLVKCQIAPSGSFLYRTSKKTLIASGLVALLGAYWFYTVLQSAF